ncbi:Hypothetical predicted protein, partial [Marmota monax]
QPPPPTFPTSAFADVAVAAAVASTAADNAVPATGNKNVTVSRYMVNSHAAASSLTAPASGPPDFLPRILQSESSPWMASPRPTSSTSADSCTGSEVVCIASFRGLAE